MNKGIYRIAAGVGAVVILVSSCTVQASMVTTNGTPAAVATDSIVNWPAAPAVTSETAVLMDAELRKKVLTEWQNKKKETLTHPYLKEKVEWGMVPYVQAMLLARYLRGDLDGYPVFLWK